MFPKITRTGLLAVMSCVVVAVTGGCSAGASARPAGTSTAGPAPGVERCPTAGLRVDLGPGDHDMRGAHVPLRFANTTSRPCALHGAPGVSYVTGEGGEQIGLPAGRATTGPVVTLAPGETASAALFLSSAPRKTPDCEQVRAAGLRVYPPNSAEPVFVEHAATTCAPPLVGPFLEVGPVEPGADNTGA